MSKKEEDRNKILSYKFSSHSVNLLKLNPGTPEFGKERKKADRTKSRLLHFVEKVIAKKKNNS